MTRSERNQWQYEDVASDDTLTAFFLEFGREPDTRTELYMFYVSSGRAEEFAKTHPLEECDE